MAQYTPYAFESLPTSGIDVNGIYFIPESGSAGTKFNIFIRKNDNSDWVNLGVTTGVKSVNNVTQQPNGNIQLELKLSASGVLSITGGNVTINLDGRYRKNTDQIPWGDIAGAPNFALDSNVVHTSGAETISGVKTFNAQPVVPDGTSANRAVNKGQIDAIQSALQSQINNLTSAVNEGLKTPEPVDCSTSPNYPASTKGDTYQVTAAGKIGGADGVDVQVGDTVVCTADNAGGTQANVGSSFYILQSNIVQATESVSGFAKIATDAQTDAGTNDDTIVTPKKLQRKINDQTTASNQKYVRYDASQSLTAGQKTQAQNNIGAAADNSVVHLTTAETVNGVKTFGNIPVLPASDPGSDNQAARKKYVDDTVKAAVSWGGPNGKEW